MPLLKKEAKTLGREALKTGLNIARDVVQGRNIKQAVKTRLKSTRQNLFQKATDTVGPQGQRAIKGHGKRKKTRRRHTKQRKHRRTFSDKNGTSTPQLMRMHEMHVRGIEL